MASVDRTSPSRLVAVVGTTVVIGSWLVAMVVAATAEEGSTRAFTGLVGSAASLLALTGALLAARRPDNPLLWVLAASGTCVTLGVAGSPDPDPASPIAVSVFYLANGFFFIGLSLFVSFFPLLFPDGSVPGRRWRAVGWIGALGTVVAGMWAVLTLQPVGPGLGPLGSVDSGSALSSFLGGAGLLVVAAVAGGIAAMAVRYRRGSPDLRRRMRVPMLAVLVWLPFFVVINVLFERAWLGETLGPAVNLALPLLLTASLVVAVTRFRLYEIDRIVSRTVSYTLVVGLLAGVYAVVWVVASEWLPLDSDLAVASATLAAAALFSPVRRRVQRVVDRRFNRSRYQADRVVEEFGGRLREGADLEMIPRHLEAVIRDTLQPTAVGVWIRQPTR